MSGQLWAIAGGRAFSGEDVLGCCFVFPLLPLVAGLLLLAVSRNAMWPAVIALALVGMASLDLWLLIASYRPSDDWEVMDDQEKGYRLVRSHLRLLGVAGLCLFWIIGRRLLRNGSIWVPTTAEPGSSPPGQNWEWLRGWVRTSGVRISPAALQRFLIRLVVCLVMLTVAVMLLGKR